MASLDSPHREPDQSHHYVAQIAEMNGCRLLQCCRRSVGAGKQCSLCTYACKVVVPGAIDECSRLADLTARACCLLILFLPSRSLETASIFFRYMASDVIPDMEFSLM